MHQSRVAKAPSAGRGRPGRSGHVSAHPASDSRRLASALHHVGLAAVLLDQLVDVIAALAVAFGVDEDEIGAGHQNALSITIRRRAFLTRHVATCCVLHFVEEGTGAPGRTFDHASPRPGAVSRALAPIGPGKQGA